MFKMLKSAALSALIGLGAFAAMPASAQADGIYLDYHGGGIGVIVDDHDRRDRRDRWEDRRDRWEDRHDRWDDRDRWERRRCSPDRALDKAERMGIRRARVVDVSRRTITVRGRKWHDRVHVTFARAPHCPILR
ncbi:hypothetical protein [Pseudaminobacter sp. NGMCC 1.201702]|uniref:hypothetical protein n=1 Tax=Pseudaminobacter sp. NGMCC 1.201702 TaxID=3391825 RepID=UPI0039EE0893